MKKALVSPLEEREGGYRIVQIEDKEFEVAKPLFWVDVPDNAVKEEWVFHDPDGSVLEAIEAAPDFGKDRKEAIKLDGVNAAVLNPEQILAVLEPEAKAARLNRMAAEKEIIEKARQARLKLIKKGGPIAEHIKMKMKLEEGL